MLDTFQISKTFARLLEPDEFIENGWKPLRHIHTGEPTALCFNSAKGSGEPRLTLSRNRNDFWNLRAEVSLGSWLYDSNLHLPNEAELRHGLSLLSEYVESKSGIAFNAHTERVSRVDFTRDFQVGEHSVIPIIAKFARLKLPRYARSCFDETTVYFKNAGKQKTKQFVIYSKYHEMLAGGKTNAEAGQAKGLIRLEVSFRKSAVNRLAASLKLPSHHANHILTGETSERVIQTAIKQLYFDSLLTADDFSIEKLFSLYGSTTAFYLIGFLYLITKYGNDLAKQPFIETSSKTLKRYSDKCSKAGVLSLE